MEVDPTNARSIAALPELSKHFTIKKAFHRIQCAQSSFHSTSQPRHEEQRTHHIFDSSFQPFSNSVTPLELFEFKYKQDSMECYIHFGTTFND